MKKISFFLIAGLKKKLLFFCLIGPAFFLVLFSPMNIIHAAAVDLKGVEELIKNKNYSLALEKALDILNTKQALLSPNESGKLHYFIGLSYKKNGNPEMAITYLKKIESQFPTSEHAKQSWLELADIYRDDFLQRETYLEKGFEKFPQTPEAIYAGIELCKDYLTFENFKKAVPIIEKMVKTWHAEKDYPELEILQAIVYAGINDYNRAVVSLKNAENKIAGIIDNNPSYLFEAGKIYYNNRNIQKAIYYFTKLINVYPSYPDIDEAAIFLAQAHVQDKNPFMSAVFLIKVLNNGLSDQRKQYGLLLNLGKVLATLKEDELAKIKANYPRFWDAQKLLTLVNDNSPDPDQKKSAAILLSGEFGKTGDFKKAADNYYRFLEIQRDPLVEKLFKENLDLYLNSLQKEKKYDEVLKFWLLMRERKSFLSGSNLLKIAAVLFDMQLYANAQEIYSFMDEYTMFSQFWPTVRQQLARLYFKTWQYDEYLEIRAKMVIDPMAEPEKSEFIFYTLQAYKQAGFAKELNNALKTVSLNPKTIDNVYQFKILLLKAEALGEENDPASYAAASGIYKELTNYKGLTPGLRIDLLMKTGDLNFNRHEWQHALENYNDAETYLVNNTGTGNKEWILFRKISIFYEINRPAEAQKTLAELRKINPKSFWIQQAEKMKRNNME